MTRLAVVEDNPDSRLLAEAILGDHYEVASYENAVVALRGMEQSVPDLVLMDISLPGLDGVEALARMRASARLESIPVVALTAHAMAGDKQKYLQLGFNGYVSKPIEDERLLLDLIRELLQRKADRTSAEDPESS